MVDFIAILSGGLLLTEDEAPSIPVLTYTDNGDNTGGIVTVSNSNSGATNQLYYMKSGESSYTTGNNRTGNGNITLSITIGNYWIYVKSTVGANSSISLIYRIYVEYRRH